MSLKILELQFQIRTRTGPKILLVILSIFRFRVFGFHLVLVGDAESQENQNPDRRFQVVSLSAMQSIFPFISFSSIFRLSSSYRVASAILRMSASFFRKEGTVLMNLASLHELLPASPPVFPFPKLKLLLLSILLGYDSNLSPWKC